MTKSLSALLVLLVTLSSFTRQNNKPVLTEQGSGEPGLVTGRVTDSKGNAMPGVKIVIEHTVWFGTYLYATTDSKGYYKCALPAEPAGSWTVKAQVDKTAYGQLYTLDLRPSSQEPVNRNKTVRDFTWTLSGKRPEPGQYYGAHLDLYQFGADVPMDKVKIILTPVAGDKLVDGSPAVAIERTVEDVAGTFMAKDIPIGRYTVKAVYRGKTLLLDNRHDNKDPEMSKTVVFGKNGHLAKTDYNIEFWLTE